MSGTPSAGGRSRVFLTSLVTLTVAVVLLAQALPATADILPSERRTVWNPGIPGGVPQRTTVCATVNASTYGNGSSDATAGIQAAIDACPVGQVVQLSAGNFLVNGAHPITIDKGVVLRGAGPAATRLLKTTTTANPLILVGRRWLEEAGSANLTANAPKGATSVQVISSAGLSVGQLVVLDELTDDSYVYWGKDSAAQPGGPARGWFTRYDRPVGQMLEIAAISGNTVSFTTPLHIAFDTAHTAQLTRYTIPYGAKNAGVEDLYVRGGQDDNITLRFALYSWVKNVESDMSMGDSFALDFCFRCVLRDSYAHDTPNPFPGGAGYMLSIAEYTADSLVENNIFINGNKVMVMRASGGGNVIGYNYFDNGYIGNFLGWMETGLNASHLTCPHFELFEGNQAFNIDGDDTWGGAVYNTFFRNHATGKRRSYPDTSSRRAIGLMYGHYYYSFVGNVLGTANQSPAPQSGFAFEDFWPWSDDPVALWRIGYTPTDWDAPPEARVVNTTHRHGNFDYVTDSVQWASGFDQTLPSSLYLASKPAFFGSNPWPWVEPTGASQLYTLPARARYDAGNPTSNDPTLTVAKSGTGNGTLSSTPAGIDCGADCIASYTAGTVVTLDAAPAADSSFSGWSGACSGTGSCQVTMSTSTSVTASFALDVVSHALTVTKAGSGSGSVTSSPAGINCGASCSASYSAGTVVSLTASAAAGSSFSGWGGGCSGTGSCQVTMSAATSVTASFALDPVNHTLTVARLGTGSGSVTSSPAGISCGAACSASYSAGTVVNLTASAAAGSSFSGWGGACSGTGSCQVTMSAARSVTATFALNPVSFTLTAATTGTGSGTLTSSPGGITCGAACSASYAAGTVVNLSAAPAAGSVFSGWSGACSGSGACQVTINAAVSVTATFTLDSSDPTLTVVRAGTGSGAVASCPPAIICGPACSASYTPGSIVTLTAAAAAGSTFTGWSGACSGTGPCDVTVSAATSVTANFTFGSPGLVAAWGFNDGAGTTTRDSSLNNNTGTLVNGPVWTTGKNGGALQFDGVNDRVRANDSSSLDLTSASTFEAWILPTVAPAGWRTILQKEVDAYFFTASGGGGGSQPTSGGTLGGSCCTFVTSPSVLPVNTWTHVAATYDGALLRFYVNGSLVASEPASGSYLVNTSPLWIGGNAVYGEHFKGKLDDIRVYNRALTQAEIQQDMATAIP